MLREIINYVESIEYDCHAGLANGVTMLKRNMEETPKVIELVELCKDRAVAIFILGHMLEISTRHFDPQYRNPWETAMATYLHAVTQARPDLKKSAVAVAQSLKGAYWPSRYIKTFLE